MDPDAPRAADLAQFGRNRSGCPSGKSWIYDIGNAKRQAHKLIPK
jgi:hypothetical protein